MQNLDIKYEVYISMSCFIQDMLKVYTNEVIVTEEILPLLLKELERAQFNPSIYVINTSQSIPQNHENSKFSIKRFSSYY